MNPEESTAYWTRLLTIATAGIGILTALFSGLQWLDIRKNVQETKNALEVAQIQAKAAQTQADASNVIARNAQAQTDAIVAQQRSYVGLSEASIDYISTGKRVKSLIKLRNYGLPTEVCIYTISQTYDSENIHQLLSDDAVHLQSDCKAATLEKDSKAKSHTRFLGVIFPTENREIFSEADNVQADDDLLSGRTTYVRVDCIIYRVGPDIKHTMSCFSIKPPLHPAPPMPPSAPPGLIAFPKMANCDTASFAE